MNVEIWTVTEQFRSWNICFQFSALVLCSALPHSNERKEALGQLMQSIIPAKA